MQRTFVSEALEYLDRAFYLDDDSLGLYDDDGNTVSLSEGIRLLDKYIEQRNTPPPVTGFRVRGRFQRGGADWQENPDTTLPPVAMSVMTDIRVQFNPKAWLLEDADFHQRVLLHYLAEMCAVVKCNIYSVAVTNSGGKDGVSRKMDAFSVNFPQLLEKLSQSQPGIWRRRPLRR